MRTLTKFLVISIFAGMLPGISYAQTKPEKVNATSAKRLQGVISPLNEPQTWAIVYPKKLRYWNDTMNPGGFSATLFGYPQNMDAKRAKNGMVADYTFMLVSEGVKNLRQSNIVAYPQGGVLVEYTYTFPCALQVLDKDNNVLKTFILSDDEKEMTATVHPAFLDDLVSRAESTKIPVVSGFKDEETAIKAIDAKKNDYFTRIEYNTYYDFVWWSGELISNGYGYPRLYYVPSVLELNKKEKPKFEDLNEKIGLLKSAIDEYISAEVKDGVMERLIELGRYFESNYDPASATKDVIQLYAFNSAMAYLFGGAPDDAYRQFLIAEPSAGFISMLMSGFRTLYPLVTEMNNLYATRNEPETVYLKAYTVDERKKMEQEALALAKKQLADAKMEELAARNITDVPGYVMTADGVKAGGNISIKFIELYPSQIVDMSIGKVVWVKAEKAQTFKAKEVLYFMAGEKRYEPVTIPGSVAVKALGALLSGNIDNTYFMEVVYTNGDFTACVDPSIVNSESYFVKNNADGTTGSYSNLINGGKASEKFLGGRFPELAERIGAQEFTSSRESLISFIDALADGK